MHTINNTTREERRVCYITLNRPEEEHSGPEDIPSVKAILNTLLPLEMLLPVPDLTSHPRPIKKMSLRHHQVENKRVVKKDSDNTCMADFNNNLYAIINLLRSP